MTKFFISLLICSIGISQGYGGYSDCIEGEFKKPLVLTIEKAVNIALSSSRRLAQPFNAIETAEINIEVVESDFDWKIFPRGDAGIAGGEKKVGTGLTWGAGFELLKKFSHGTRFSFNPSATTTATNFQSNLRTSIKQPLMRGFGTEYTLAPVRAAQYSRRSAYRNFYLAQVRLILQTIQGLYDISRQEALVELDRESLARIQKYCASTKIKEKIGLCDAMDTYRSEIELKHAEDALSQSLERLQDAKDTLRDTLSLPLDQEIEVRVTIEYDPIDINVDEAIGIALATRIEIDQARDQIEEAKRNVRIAEKNLMPDLNLTLDYTSYAYGEEFTSAWTNDREAKWGVGLTTNTDFDQISQNAAYDQSRMARQDSIRNEHQVHENITLEVKRTIRSLTRAQEKITLQEEQVQNSSKEFYLAKLKFEHGLANNFDLIQAEKNLRAAQTALISAIIEHKVGGFKLLAALGTLADKPGICQ